MRISLFSSIGAIFALCTVMVSGQTLNVKIIQRQNSETGYTYQVPGHMRSMSDGNANCDANSYGYSTDVNCHGSGTTNTTITAPQTISYSVTGATYSLLLPDGRIAVVNCASKSPSFMTGFAAGVAASNGSSNTVAMRRSCHTPLIDEIQVEFKGKYAKLKWPVSIDGKKFESETYTILAVLDSVPKQSALPENHDSNGAPTVPFPEQTSASNESTPSTQSIATPTERVATDDAKTQFHLGTLYETGKSVPQDYAQAVLWYSKAAEQNLAIAQYRLGVLYANGVGVPLDKAQAAAWFHKAAEQGYVYAQEMLGSDYLTGAGIQRDYAEAYFWYDIACASKAPEFVTGMRATMRDSAAIYLTPADLSRARERSRKWLEDHPAKP